MCVYMQVYKIKYLDADPPPNVNSVAVHGKQMKVIVAVCLHRQVPTVTAVCDS